MKGFKHLLLLMVIAFPILCTPITALAANESSSTSSSSANNPSQVASNDSVQKIKQKGTLVVGMSADYPPYEFTTKENGKTKYVGFEVSLAKQFAKDLGVKLVIKNMDFDSLLVALETGKIDAIISGMNVTAERKKSVDFSNTYYSGDSYFLINKGDKDKLVNVKSFNGKNVGAQNGTLQSTLISKEMPKANGKGLAKLSSLVIGLQSHKYEGFYGCATAKAYAANNSNLYAFIRNCKYCCRELQAFLKVIPQ